MRSIIILITMTAAAFTAACGLASKGDSKDDPATRPILGIPAGWELVPKATYSATQKSGEVTIKATGENPTAGCQTKLYQSPLRIWPPQWMLARKRPDGVAAQVITPFDVSASFKSTDPVKSVKVRDAAGDHDVTVEQAQD